ncbi:MAG: peptidylprolyl isomerase [bacterium]
MKRTDRLSSFLTWIILASCALRCDHPGIDEGRVALVDGKTISAQDFIISYELTPYPYLKKHTSSASRKQAHLDWLIDKKLLAADAIQKGFDQKPEVQCLLKWYEKKEAVKQLYREVVQSNVEISERELRQAFLQLNETVRARHLFADEESKAWRIHEQIESGIPFEEIAQLTFRDPKLAENGGDLGEFTWGDMDPEFEQAVFRLQPGEISPPVRTQWGYHIIKLEDRKKNPLVTEAGFQARKSYVARIIQRRKEAKLASEFVNQFMTPKEVKLKGAAFAVLASHLVEEKNDERISLPKPLDPEIQSARTGLIDHLEETLVEFKGGRWTLGEFLTKLAEMPITDRPNTSSRTSLENGIGVMVRDELLAREAFRQGLRTMPSVRAEIEKRKEEVLYTYYRQEIEKSVRVTEEELQVYFAHNRSKYDEPEKVNIREILVRTKEEAERMKRYLEAGHDMAQLAGKYSIRRWAAKRGGEFGYFSRQRYGEIGKLAFSQQVGEICGPLKVAGGPPRGGFSVFKIMDRIPGRGVGFEEVEDRVKAEVLARKKEQAIAQVAESLRTNARIVIDNQKLASLSVTTDWAENPISLFAFPR